MIVPSPSVCLVLFLLLADVSLASEPVFYRRDGSASFPGVEVPHDFDGESGKHIRWKTPLPNWSNSSPIVDVGKVFLLSEPVASEGYAPILHCIDADAGRELWQRELDPVTCLPAGEQEEVRRFAKKTWAMLSRQYVLWSEAYLIWKEHQDAFDGWDKPPAALAERWAAIRKEVEADGREFKEIKGGAGGPAAPFGRPRVPKQKPQKALRDLCLGMAAWRGFGTWLGVAYPTPVSHEGRVYVLTQHNHFVCYSHAGELIWQRRFPKTDRRLLTEATRYRVPKDWRPECPGQGGFSTAPIMADGLLLSIAGQMLRALDAKTGEPRWELPYPWAIGQWHCYPTLARVDGIAVMIAAGGTGKGFAGDERIRLNDGISVGFLPNPVGGRGRCANIVIDDDLVVTNTPGANNKKKRATVAYRLSWNADRSAIVCTEVWRLENPKGFEVFKGSPWVDGQVHHPSGVLDLRSGTMVRSPGYKALGKSRGEYDCIVGRAYCGVDPKKGTFRFFDRKTGEALGTGSLPVNPVDGKPAAHKQAEEFRMKEWRCLGAAKPFAVGKRLYFRSYDFLWCIAP